MTNEELDAIRERARRLSGDIVIDRDIERLTKSAREDVPKLLAEIERLKGMTAWYRHAAQKHAESGTKEVERLRKLAHEILEGYDDSARRVIDEVVGSGRDLTLNFHEFLINSYQKEINGVDDENGI
jgi:hypothetical protein